MSTKPGVTRRPRASISSRPRPEIDPICAIRPADTAISLTMGAAPVPSTTDPPPTTKSKVQSKASSFGRLLMTHQHRLPATKHANTAGCTGFTENGKDPWPETPRAAAYDTHSNLPRRTAAVLSNATLKGAGP